MNRLILTSPAFTDGEWIPDRNAGYGEDLSPELHISGIDSEAASMVVSLDDLGHPIKPGFNHWIAWNIPITDIIPEGIPKGSVNEDLIHVEQGMAYGKHCYRGPKPPFNWNHEYLFTVYTLDCRLDISTDSNKEDVLAAAKEHILQRTELTGKYQRKHKC